MASPALARGLGRLASWGRFALVAVVFALAVLVPSSYVAVEKSSEPAFCNSCHIMEPYYDSWERSAHADIACTECHFEPGTMGTVRGKFQAITQLAKYVTRTQGTRPWADVSDTSCMRSGCHSRGELEGPIEFGRVSFDHGPHLLEVRGQRLRCVTCHTQVLVDQHFAVESNVCFQCHFHPGEDGRVPARTGDCRTCHGAPEDALEVAGRPFDHGEYLARGVACSACHAGAVAGKGTVHAQRCRSCHGQPELLAALDDPARLHHAHVTEKKVECFECHVEIQHGREAELATHSASHGSSDQACDACHDRPHDAALRVFAGVGASGAPPQPSRMFATHVACSACHTGRSGSSASAHLARAGEADCLHCHGTGFAGMLAEWQGAVGQGLAHLRPLVQELAAAQPPAGATADLLRAADQDLALLEQDGSRGAHNAPYALDVLRAVAARVDQVRAEVEPGATSVSSLLPPPADAECAACHVDVSAHDPLEVHGRAFHHAAHLRTAGLRCAQCHALEPHGAPAFARDRCAECHHAESETRDPSDCASCHSVQQSFLEGTLAGLADAPVVMVDKGCTECHGEAPGIVVPAPKVCVLCHEEGYDQTLEQWRTRTDELLARLRSALAAAPPGTDPAHLARARAALQAVTADGSRGVHNAELAQRLLGGALEELATGR